MYNANLVCLLLLFDSQIPAWTRSMPFHLPMIMPAQSSNVPWAAVNIIKITIVLRPRHRHR